MQNGFVVSVLALSWFTCMPVAAQENRDLAVGDKVRIWLKDGKTVGILAALEAQTLTLKDLASGQLTAHSLNTVQGVEVSRGRHSRGKKAGKGALIGGAIGAGLGVGATTFCDQNSEGCRDAWVLIGGAAFGATGALLGALIGVAMSPGEAWRPANVKGLQASVSPAPGGVQFRVTIGF